MEVVDPGTDLSVISSPRIRRLSCVATPTGQVFWLHSGPGYNPGPASCPGRWHRHRRRWPGHGPGEAGKDLPAAMRRMSLRPAPCDQGVVHKDQPVPQGMPMELENSLVPRQCRPPPPSMVIKSGRIPVDFLAWQNGQEFLLPHG